MPILRENLRIRDELARPHPTAAPGDPRALPLLSPVIHQEQHGEAPHRPGAQARGQPQDDPRQVRQQGGAARPALHGAAQPDQRAPQQPEPGQQHTAVTAGLQPAPGCLLGHSSWLPSGSHQRGRKLRLKVPVSKKCCMKNFKMITATATEKIVKNQDAELLQQEDIASIRKVV